MIYLKINGLVLEKEKFKERDAIVYILTEKDGVWKCGVKGLYRQESKNLTLIEPGNFNRFFIITDLEKKNIISCLPLKIMPATLKNYPYTFLWTLKIIKKLKILETPKFIWFVLKNLDRYLKEGGDFPFWFLFHLLRELGYEIDLENCMHCGRRLKNFAFYSSQGLFCSFCRKASYQRIEKSDLDEAKKIKNLAKIPKKVPHFLKIILKNTMLKLD